MKQPWQQQQQEQMRRYQEQLRQQQQERLRRQQEQLRQEQQERIRQQQEHMRRQQQDRLRQQQIGAAWLEQQRRKAQQQQARLGRWRTGATPIKPQLSLSSHEPNLRPGYVAGEGPSCLGRLVRMFLYLLIIAAVLYLIAAGLGLGSGF